MSRGTRRRIALVTHGLAEGGGVPNIAMWLRSQLGRSNTYDVDVHVLATARNDPRSRQLCHPKTWTRSIVPSYDHELASWMWGCGAAELEFSRYAKRRKLSAAMREYDLIHVVAGSPAWGNPVVGLGVPVVLEVATLVNWERTAQLNTIRSASALWRKTMTGITTRLEGPTILKADMVIVINDVMRDYVRSLGQPHVVNAAPGTDTAIYVPDRVWNVQGHLLSVCRFGDQRKGLERLIRAYSLMVKADPAMPPLVMAGRGDVPPSLRDLVQNLHLDSRIYFRTDVAAQALPDLYRSASVYLQASYEEGLGISVVEAMSCGIPVVATETAGTLETVVDGQTGWLVKQGRDDEVSVEIAQRTLEIFAEGQGPSMSVCARNRAIERFSNAGALTNVLMAYERLLKTPT